MQAENPDLDTTGALAQIFMDDARSRRLRLVMRYVAAIRREYQQTLRVLEAAIAARIALEEATLPEIGSVSYSRPAVSAAALNPGPAPLPMTLGAASSTSNAAVPPTMI